VTLSSYLDIKARSRLLMKGSFVVATKSRKTWARCLLNSLSNMPNPNNILKAECYPEATAWQNGTCFKDVDKLGRQEFDMAEPRIRLGMVGGGEGAFIGAVHRIAARLDDRYELVAVARVLEIQAGAMGLVVRYRLATRWRVYSRDISRAF
jgi:hypothetical protein